MTVERLIIARASKQPEKNGTTRTLSALHYLNLDPCSVSAVMLHVSVVTFFVDSMLDEEKVKCFVEDATDVSASGRSVGQVECSGRMLSIV